MAFLGSIGKFFTSPAAAIIFPPAAITVAAVGALAGGKNPLPAVLGLYGPRGAAPGPPGSGGLNPDQRLLSAQTGAFGGTAAVSGSYLSDLYYDQPGVQPGETEYWGGPSWQTEMDSLPISRWTPAAPAPGQEMDLLTVAERFLPEGISLLG